MNRSPNQPGKRSGKGTERWRAVCTRPAFWTLVCAVGLLLFVWPFIPSSHPWTAQGRYIYLFGAWAWIIVVIVVIAGNLPPFRQGPTRHD